MQQALPGEGRCQLLVQGFHLPELGSAGVVVVVGAATDKAVAALRVCGVVRRRIVDNNPRCDGHIDRRVVQPIICNVLHAQGQLFPGYQEILMLTVLLILITIIAPNRCTNHRHCSASSTAYAACRKARGTEP